MSREHSKLPDLKDVCLTQPLLDAPPEECCGEITHVTVTGPDGKSRVVDLKDVSFGVDWTGHAVVGKEELKFVPLAGVEEFVPCETFDEVLKAILNGFHVPGVHYAGTPKSEDSPLEEVWKASLGEPHEPQGKHASAVAAHNDFNGTDVHAAWGETQTAVRIGGYTLECTKFRPDTVEFDGEDVVYLFSTQDLSAEDAVRKANGLHAQHPDRECFIDLAPQADGTQMISVRLRPRRGLLHYSAELAKEGVNANGNLFTREMLERCTLKPGEQPPEHSQEILPGVFVVRSSKDVIRNAYAAYAKMRVLQDMHRKVMADFTIRSEEELARHAKPLLDKVCVEDPDQADVERWREFMDAHLSARTQMSHREFQAQVQGTWAPPEAETANQYVRRKWEEQVARMFRMPEPLPNEILNRDNEDDDVRPVIVEGPR